MNCPNCGLAHPDGARFCANCGTQFGGAPANPPGSAFSAQPSANPTGFNTQYSAPGPYRTQGGGNSTAKNIGLGCLVALLIFFFLGLSCTRSCFGLRHRTHYYRRY